MPGAPAQVLALGDQLLVTIRDPGMLLIFDVAEAELREEARVALPDDAWGLSLTRDAKTAIVSSAWTHRVSAVDLPSRALRWSVEVAPEPRGIAIMPDGATAYVTHLRGADITRIDAPTSAAPKVSLVMLPAARTRAPLGKRLYATLAYAPVLSPDARRLYVPRHAIGAIADAWDGPWWGAATVDVMLTADDTPLVPKRINGWRAKHKGLRLPGREARPRAVR